MKKGILKLNLILSIVLIATMFFIFYHLYFKSFHTIEIKIESSTDQINTNSFFLTYLKTPINNVTMIDYILYYYFSGEKSILEKETTEIITEIYGEEAKWKLDVGGKSVSNYVSVTSTPEISEITVPLFSDAEYINIRLNVYLK